MGGGPIDEGQRSGFGVVGDIIVGVIGALLGGFLFRTLDDLLRPGLPFHAGHSAQGLAQLVATLGSVKRSSESV